MELEVGGMRFQEVDLTPHGPVSTKDHWPAWVTNQPLECEIYYPSQKMAGSCSNIQGGLRKC